MYSRENPDNIQKVSFVSPWVIFFSVLQVLALFFFRYVSGTDNTEGYVSGLLNPVLYTLSFFLVLTVVNSIVKKTVGLFDLLVAAMALVITYAIF